MNECYNKKDGELTYIRVAQEGKKIILFRREWEGGRDACFSVRNTDPWPAQHEVQYSSRQHIDPWPALYDVLYSSGQGGKDKPSPAPVAGGGGGNKLKGR